jgi:hypothetical protein
MVARSVGLSIRVENHVPEVMRLLEKVPDDIVRGGIKEGVRVAKIRVPVLTGALRESIHAERDGTGWALVSDKDYAAIIEFGGVNRPAQPYMRPGSIAAQLYMKAELSKFASEVSHRYG